MKNLYQISFYVPEKHCEAVKQAMFNAGAGKLGNYQECSWQVAGQGQFKPLEGSQPFLGKKNQLEQVNEFKVEMLCDEKALKTVIAALLEHHPYEEPAYFIVRNELGVL